MKDGVVICTVTTPESKTKKKTAMRVKLRGPKQNCGKKGVIMMK